MPQRPTCPYFQKGTCQYGPTCRLSHQLQPSSSSNNPFNPKRACTFYAQGRCTKGDQCTYLHPQTRTSSSTQSQNWRRGTEVKKADDSTPTNNAAAAPCAFFRKGKCAKGQECPFPHPEGQNPLCPFYLNGTCRFGSKCSSSHGGGAVDTPVVMPRAVREYKPIVIRSENTRDNVNPVPRPEFGAQRTIEAAKDSLPPVTATATPTPTPTPTVEHTFFHCKASFGPGAQITEITTSFESRTLIISNIPDDDDQGTLIAAFEPFGRLEKIALLRDTDTATARVTYASASEASSAIHGLRASPYEPKMDLKVVESGHAVLRSTKVKISWFAPRRIGWAHYPTITAAKTHAKRLHGATFDGYLLDATFQTPSIHQTRSFSVELKGLPAHASEEHLKRFCKSNSVQLKRLGYDRRSSLLDVEAQLTAIGPLDRFDAMPEDKQRPKILAFAQFAQPDDAARAVATLHQSTQSFLNRSPMWLEHIHAVKYTIPQPLFEAVKGALDAVKDGELKECKLRVYGPETTDSASPEVCIRLFSPNAKALGVMKRRLETILDGHRVMDKENRVVWDDFFATAEGLAYLRQLDGVYVKCDSRNRSIHLYGTDDNVAVVTELLLEKSERLKTEKSTIKLDKSMLRHLMKGGLENLIAEFGDPSMAIDIVQRTLKVGEADADEVQRRLAAANIQHGSGEDTQQQLEACPVCYCEITNSVMLQCGHTYCKECLAHMLTTTSPSSPTAKCIHEGNDLLCNTGIDLAVIRDLLRPEQEQHLFQTAFLAYIHARGDEFKYCPTPDCGVVYRAAHEGTALTCPSCVNRICAACHVQFHEGLTCAQHRDNAEGGNQQFQEWKAVNGVKECPNCRANIQKSEGCNHMTCSRCQTHMCWVCLRTFEATRMDSKGGIYEHMRQAHGGYS